jgi:hypothetical protein
MQRNGEKILIQIQLIQICYFYFLWFIFVSFFLNASKGNLTTLKIKA